MCVCVCVGGGGGGGGGGGAALKSRIQKGHFEYNYSKGPSVKRHWTLGF